MNADEKICSTCGKTKPQTECHLRKAPRSKPGYRAAQCKTCYHAKTLEWQRNNPTNQAEIRRRTRLLKKYGMTVSEYEAMLAEQGGVCAICGGENSRDRRFSVDHCHHTGAVRGILCDKCNMALGLLGDDPALLAAATAYLNAHTQLRIAA